MEVRKGVRVLWIDPIEMKEWNFALNVLGKENGKTSLQITREESLEPKKVLEQCSGKQVVVVNSGNPPFSKVRKLLQEIREKCKDIAIGIVGERAPLLENLGDFIFESRPLFFDEIEELKARITEAGENESERAKERE